MAKIHIDLSDTISTLRKQHQKLSEKRFNRITVNAINHTIRKARTAGVKEIRKTYGANSRIIKKHLNFLVIFLMIYVLKYKQNLTITLCTWILVNTTYIIKR